MMGNVFLISVILKGIGAVLEVLLQIVLTREIGLDGYGTYSMWINSADMIFWGLFSGIVKCNTFYLSGNGGSIRSFRTKYYIRYVIPVLSVVTLLLLFGNFEVPWIIVLITLTELIMLDKSSVMLAEGKSLRSLLGEYILGRGILLAGVCILRLFGDVTIINVTIIYILQYIAVILYFMRRSKNDQKHIENIPVSTKKWWRYQSGDVLNSLVGKMPVILQYFVVGALEAGVISVVILVKKLINFISGPTAKIFLPEFSKLYREKDMLGIRTYYESIIRIQLIFTGPMAVLLIGYSEVILRILAEELLPYKMIFMICSAVFLLSATLGPCAGLLQMTDNEKLDNRCRIVSITTMFLVFWIFRKSALFVAYGLCVQNFMEALSKYVLVCRWFKGSPIRIISFIKWWSIPIGCILAARILHLQNSLWLMLLTAGSVFLYFVYKEYKQGVLRGFFVKKKIR